MRTSDECLAPTHSARPSLQVLKLKYSPSLKRRRDTCDTWWRWLQDAAMTGWLKVFCMRAWTHHSSLNTPTPTPPKSSCNIFTLHIISHHHLSLFLFFFFFKKKPSLWWHVLAVTRKLVTFQIKQQQQQHINHGGRQWDAA